MNDRQPLSAQVNALFQLLAPTAIRDHHLTQGHGPGLAEFVVICVILMATVALSIDIMLPSSGDMAGNLHIQDNNGRQWITTALFAWLTVGQALLLLMPWRGLFGVLAVIGIGAVLWLLLRQPETLAARRYVRPRALLAALNTAMSIVIAYGVGLGFDMTTRPVVIGYVVFGALAFGLMLFASEKSSSNTPD